MLSLYNGDVCRRSADASRMNEAANGGLSERLRTIASEKNPIGREMTRSAIAKTNENPEIRP